MGYINQRLTDFYNSKTSNIKDGREYFREIDFTYTDPSQFSDFLTNVFQHKFNSAIKSGK